MKCAVFDLSQQSMEAATANGVMPAKSAEEAVQAADIVITMLPAGKHVVSVYGALIKAAAPGTLFIDSSTIDVQSARDAHAMAKAAGMVSVDAPVSGGTGGATAGTLTFMAGGETEAFARAEPILSAMGRRIVHCGSAGAGPGGKDLQQHDPQHIDDCCLRSFCSRREARAVAPGFV